LRTFPIIPGNHPVQGRIFWEFADTELDAAVNIIRLDGYFDKEVFQSDNFKGAVGAGKWDSIFSV
jgi:hypothetical protein